MQNNGGPEDDINTENNYDLWMDVLEKSIMYYL